MVPLFVSTITDPKLAKTYAGITLIKIQIFLFQEQKIDMSNQITFLTARSTVLLEKQIVPRLAQEFPAFY